VQKTLQGGYESVLPAMPTKKEKQKNNTHKTETKLKRNEHCAVDSCMKGKM
jgi:hypothetical protein